MKCEVAGGWSCGRQNDATLLCRLWPDGRVVRVCSRCGDIVVLCNRLLEEVAGREAAQQKEEEQDPPVAWACDC